MSPAILPDDSSMAESVDEVLETHDVLCAAVAQSEYERYQTERQLNAVQELAECRAENKKLVQAKAESREDTSIYLLVCRRAGPSGLVVRNKRTRRSDSDDDNESTESWFDADDGPDELLAEGQNVTDDGEMNSK